MINPLPDYIEDEDSVLYEIDIPDENFQGQGLFFRKLRYRIGSIVILTNALERVVEDCLLEMMNERAEDPRVWILIQDFNLDKKINRLKSIYVETIRIAHDKNSALLSNVQAVFSKLDETRRKRNIYVHSNWLNNYNLKYFETKVKEIKRKEGFFRVRKTFALEDLDSFIQEIELVTNDLEELHETIFSF
jgi:hypothetical protein